MDERTKMPLSWAAAIILALAGSIGNAAVGQYRVGRLEDDLAGYKLELAQKSLTQQAQELKLQRLADSMDTVKESTKRIEEAVKELSNRKH